jgi:hypothetical protein
MEYRDNATPSDIVSGAFDVEVVTINAASTGQGADQPCREVIIWPEEGKDIKIGGSAASAAAGPVLADGVSNAYLRIPISNTNKLFFNGTQNDTVNILWRS